MVLSGCSRPSSRAKSVALIFVNSTPPVFFNVTKELFTSPIPWVTSMLVLQPSTLMAIDGPLGDAVNVAEVVEVLVSVAIGALVLVGAAVDVATEGVGLLTPITTGVAVKID